MSVIRPLLQPQRWMTIAILLFLLATVLPLVLLGPASPAGGRVAASATKLAQTPVTWRGAEAVAQLKQQGSYDALAAAMSATQYQLRWVERPALKGLGGAWQAANPAQGLEAYFTPGAVRIAEHSTAADGAATGKSAKQVGRQPAWQFGMKLTSYGYGDRLSTLSEGLVTTNGQRVELARTALLNPCATITEWYVNEAAGLEQGFTLAAPPEPEGLKGAGEKLRLKLALTGDLRARAGSDGQSVALVNGRGAQVLSYGGLMARDARGRKLEARMVVDEGEVVLEVEDAGAVYPVVIDPTFRQFAKLIASDGAAGDGLGSSVALSGDTALIGALYDIIGGNRIQGSAYVFVHTGTTWVQQQKLTASDGGANDYFGVSVALSGDTALIGAYSDDIGMNVNQGSVYVFVRSGTTWMQQQQLTASDGAADDFFGGSVALSAETALVGAKGADIGGYFLRGSAYVFVRSGTTWMQRQPLTASDGTAYDNFGGSVALSEDTALVGAFGDTIGGKATQGSAYVFSTIGAACPIIDISPASLPPGTAGSPYSQTLTGSGGVAPYSFTISAGALPNGLTLTGGGLLSGAPTTFGPFNFTVLATDSGGCTGPQPYTLTINSPCGTITVNPATLPNGTFGAAYNQTATATGGTPAYTFTVSAGSLPGGLNLSSGGALTGTPNATGTFNFTIKATDANGCLGTRAYTVIIPGGSGVITGLQYYPLATPVRLLDTRPDPFFPSCIASSTALGAMSTTPFNTLGACAGIPTSARALVGNATIVNTQSVGGYITLWPTGATQPNASNLNFKANQIVPNAFTVGLDQVGNFSVFASAETDFIVDVTGYYAPPGAGGLYFHPLAAPVRLLDTRPDPGFSSCLPSSTPLGTLSTTTLLSTGACTGVPTTARVLVGNATVVNSDGAMTISDGGYITLWPAWAAQPNASNLNYIANQIVPNSFVVGLDRPGQFNVYAQGGTNFIVDVTGYYDDQAAGGLLFYPLSSPGRWLDTRPDPGFPSCIARSTPLAAMEILSLQAEQTCGSVTIPAEAQAVLGNATVVNLQSSGGYITLWPSDASQPNASNLNYVANQIVPNAFVVGLSAGGAFNIFASGATDFIIDLSGYFAP